MEQLKRFGLLLGFLILYFGITAMPAHAATASSVASDIGTMFANGTKTWVAAQNAIIMAGYLMGAYFIIAAIMKMPQTADPQARVSPKQPIAMFCVGIALFTLMGFLESVTATMSMGSGAGDVLIGTVSSGGNATMSAAITGVLTFIRMIGYIAFIRGWLMLNQSAQGKDGMMGRALTHICGGVAAINVKITALMLAATFAPNINISQWII